MRGTRTTTIKHAIVVKKSSHVISKRMAYYYFALQILSAKFTLKLEMDFYHRSNHPFSSTVLRTRVVLSFFGNVEPLPYGSVKALRGSLIKEYVS